MGAAHNPVRRRIAWSQIESVQELGRYAQVVVLRLVDGSDRKTGLPPKYAQQVASIGNVPLT